LGKSENFEAENVQNKHPNLVKSRANHIDPRTEAHELTLLERR